MGTISSPAAIYALSAIGTPTKTQVSGTQTIGVSQTSISLTGATKAYCVSATLASSGDTLTIDTETGIATVGTTPVAQVETATVVAAAGATSNGNLPVTVTGARITGSPVAVSVALTTADNTAALVAAKIRSAIGANTAISAVYTVGGSGADVVLTETDPENNDTTLNIAWTAALGVSAVTSSTNTTAGVGGVKLTNNTGDGKDFEGISLGTMLQVLGFVVKSTGTGTIGVDIGTTDYAVFLQGSAVSSAFDPAGTNDWIGTMTIEAISDAAAVEVTLIAV